ncbi:MAG: phosphodiester glycosidase family protein [Clostridia bacterium]|nr:phosphodiester glycosidase family protein [Clostridia bacterium]
MLKRTKVNKNHLTTICLFLMTLIAIYAGHFLLSGTPEEKKVPEKTASSFMKDEKENLVKYKHLSISIHEKKQEIYILEVDLRKKKVEVKPVLSHDSVFGFEKLSSMASRNNAYAAINGGFFYPYGEPSGMVVIDGELINSSQGKNPVLMLSDGKAAFKEIKPKIQVNYDKGTLVADSINNKGAYGKFVVYTKWYGTDNMVKSKNITLTVDRGIIQSIKELNGPSPIPENGMLLTFYSGSKYTLKNMPFKVGDPVKLVLDQKLNADTQAYECGSWVVKNGKVVINHWDEWTGVTTNSDPRTVVGLKDEYNVVFIAVDGRQPGYSIGLTGKELGHFLLENGIKNAAMLDGGASTEMLFNQKIINRPSFKGQERMLGGGFIIKYKEDE